MTSDKKREYLEAKIRTANSAQLHLMLLDGAIRFAREAEKGVLRSDEIAYQTPLLKAMDIVEELLAGVRHSTDELNEKLAQLYTFVYMRLTSVYVGGDRRLIGEALQILDVQRETWRLAVAQLAEQAKAEEAAPARPKTTAPKPHLGADHAASPTGGLSIEA